MLIDGEEVSYIQLKAVVNRKTSFSELCGLFGFDGKEYSLCHIDKKSIFCPFHQNTDTKAASIFKGENGEERIYCYAERKIYSPCDMISMYSLDKKNELKVLFSIWRRVPALERNEILREEDSSSGNTYFLKNNDKLKALDAYRAGKISYREVCSIILSMLS